MIKLFVILALVSWANEKTPAPSEPAKVDDKKATSSLPEWVELQTRLQTLQGKIGVSKSNIEKLMAEKSKLTANSPQARSVVEQLIAAHKEYRRLIDSYRSQENVFKFRFPERGAKELGHFEIPEIKSLTEMEQEVGVDAELSKTVLLMRDQYGDHRPYKPKTKPTEEPTVLEIGSLSHNTGTIAAREPASQNSAAKTPVKSAAEPQAQAAEERSVLESPAYIFKK